MRHHARSLMLSALVLLAAPIAATLSTYAAAPATVNLPTLKWQYATCGAAPYYCETAWYASPAVTDLDGDGKPEVVWGQLDIFAINGEDGSVQWKTDGSGRIFPPVALADLTGDGTQEIIVARNGDQPLTVYDTTGRVVWSANPWGREIRSLAVADLERDGRTEVIVARASSGGTRYVTVYEADGTQRTGWPARRDGEPGFGAGMYSQNLAVADMNGDGQKEIFAPTDTHYITALDRNGGQLAASAIYGAGKVWSQVGVHVDHSVDLRGFANCGSEHRPNFAESAPAVADVDGDGSLELLVPGSVYNCAQDYPTLNLYHLPWIFKADRTRWSGSGFDWTVLPTPAPNSAPLANYGTYDRIEHAEATLATADLDGDGKLEILYPSYDGRLHAFWLDKTEHHNWPFDVPGSGVRFSSEPAIVDLDADGQAEVIVTSWGEKAAGQRGQLHILDSHGNQLHALDLPAPGAGSSWNGALGAPTVANIDADADVEVVVGTRSSGLVAYDLPGSANARCLWCTGRGSYQRTAQAPLRAAGATPTATTVPVIGDKRVFLAALAR